jgi:hypothetical protein
MGMLFRARLPAAQANALRRCDSVPLELRRMLRESNDVELPPQQLVRRFSGKPHRFSTLADDPAVVLVELACQPPADAVRDLALGATVRAELVWNPPLYTLPLFVLSAVPLAAGLAGIRVARSRQPAVPVSIESTFDPPAANASLCRAEPDAAALRLLGEQFGEMIRDEQLDPALLATVEWALDRHGMLGAKCLAQGIREPGSIQDELEHIVDHAERNGSTYGCELFRRKQLVDRLLSLVRVIAPGQLPHTHDVPTERIAV